MSDSNNGRPHCNLCQWLEDARSESLSTLLWQTPQALVVAGDHQYFKGYCVVVSKTHVREMHELPMEYSRALFQDVLEAGRKVQKAYKPWKLNYASFGNIEEHLHWHVIPRYESDPDHKDQPWKNAAKFKDAKTTEEDIKSLRSRLLG